MYRALFSFEVGLAMRKVYAVVSVERRLVFVVFAESSRLDTERSVCF